MKSVLQDWVMELPLREQGVLLTCVRGCDLTPKEWTSDDKVAYSAARRIVAFLRWCFLNPADPREVDYQEGSFFQSHPPDPFHPSEFGHLPLHWYSHVMHSLEVIAYRHPSNHIGGIAFVLYEKMVTSLHLNIESCTDMIERLSEDRIAKRQVVS